MNEKDFFKHYRVFNLNYERLNRWYLATLVSYENSQEKLLPIIKKRRGKREKVFFKENDYGERHLIQHDLTDLNKKYGKGYAQFLDEMVLIRLVTLIEVYLVDMIESSFYYDKTKFFKTGKYEINISEFLKKDKKLLEQDYINRITNKCGRAGFHEIGKFYTKTFKINFTEFNVANPTDSSRNFNYTSLRQLHDTRHLIIHKMGKVDKKYQADYNYTKKKVNLSIDDIFFYFDLINHFANFIKDELQSKILSS